MRLATTFAIGVLLLAADVMGQSTSGKPGREQLRLGTLVGEWKFEGEI